MGVKHHQSINQSLIVYISDSDTSVVYGPSISKKPSPRKRQKGQYQKKISGTMSEMKKREENRLKASLHRRRTALYKELMHLKMTNEWEGFIVLHSKDKSKYVVGGTDANLEERFLEGSPWWKMSPT